MQAPRTVDEYLDIVDQAIFEIEELVLCAGDEGDPEDFEYSALLPVFEELSRGLKKLHADILAGTHAFGGDADLPFMALARKFRERIPFRDLLEVLNSAHKAGL